MVSACEIKSYWEKATPMSFAVEQWTYEQKRSFRYGLQDYMQDCFCFDSFKNKMVLDIGCGSGIDALEFARNGAIVTAIDITDNGVALTKQHSKEAGIPMIVMKCAGDKVPYPDESFDCIYSYGVLHHIPNVNGVMREIYRLLKPGGTVMAMVYNRDSLLYAYSIIYLRGIAKGQIVYDNKGVNELTRRYSERIEGCPYTKVYTVKEVKDMFSIWFKNVTVDVRYNVIDTMEQRKVKLGLGDEYGLGWHLIVKGMK